MYYKNRNYTRIPRKLKKKVKKICGCHWSTLTINKRLWYYLSYTNPKLHQQIINKTIQDDDNN